MKLTITIQSGTLAGRSWDLTDGFLSVGRGGNCNLIFDPTAENMVSTKHAYFETKPDGFYLVDTKSTNGTFVNGNRIQIVKLNPGDTVQFGKNGPQATVFIEMQPSFEQPPTMNPDNFPVAAHNPQPMWGEQFQNQNQNPPFVQPITQPIQNEQQFNEPFPAQGAGVRNSMNYIGLSNPVIKVDAPKNNTVKYIGAAVAVAIYGILAIITVLIMISNLGVVAAIIATVIAFIPPLIYILPLIFLDRYDPEPPWLIASAFAWGGLVAIVFSYFVNTTVQQVVFEVTRSPVAAQIITVVISAPVFEELFKGIGVVAIMIIFRREFDDVLDGIVYGGVVGLGFATVENIIYYGGGIHQGAGQLVYLFIVRGIMSPFIHSTFTAMTGIGCGISRESHNTLVRIGAPIGGYFGAVLLHMLWNGGIGVLSSVLLGGIGFYVSYFFLAVPFFAIFVGFCVYTMRRQNKILREMLAMDTARGLITNEQMETATSAIKSTSWLFGGLTSGKLMPRWNFLRAVGKLGLSYWHIQRANAAQGQTGSFQANPEFRAEVEKWRDKV